MTDPKRWLDDAAARNSAEARVLASGRELRPPAGLEAASWQDFVDQVGANADLPFDGGDAVGLDAAAAGLPLAPTNIFLLSVAKATGIGMLVGGLSMGGVRLLSPAAAPTRAGDAAAVASPAARSDSVSISANRPGETGADAPRANEPGTEAPVPAPRVAERTAPTPAAAHHQNPAEIAPPAADQALPMPSPANATTATAVADFPAPPAADGEPAGIGNVAVPPSASELQAEALELAQAKNLLQQGRAREAEALLNASATRFPRGKLAAERELLMVQTLVKLKQWETAKKRAEHYVARHPNGSITIRMKTLMGIP